MPSWNDLGTAFSTLRELDISAIREESERQPTMIAFGPRPLFSRVADLLYATGGSRYGAAGRSPLVHRPLSVGEPDDEIRRANLLLVLVDGAAPLSSADSEAISRLASLATPMVIAVCGVAAPLALGAPRSEFAHARIMILPDLAAPEAATSLGEALLDRLPAELHLAAARAIPGLRPPYASALIGSVAMTNGTYALASAIPEQIPILSVPFAAADLIVLTKNQALMVYRLALAHGAPPEFQARMAEIAPVVGGAFAWRQLARTLVGLIPFWGIVPKVAVAYAGTYATGVAATRWFAAGEMISGKRLRELTDEAMRIGRERATALIDEARARGKGARPRISLEWPRKGRRGDKGSPAPLSSGDEPT